MACTSWGYTLRGARALMDDAAHWARAEGIDAHIRERDARAIDARHQREMRAHARASKRRGARTVPPVRAHALTGIEVNARAFGTRAFRCALTLAVPACALIVPPWMLIEGNPGALLTWPAIYGYLAWNGWAHRDDVEPSEVPSVTTLPSAPTEEKTRLFSRNRTEAGLKPTMQESAIIDRINTWDLHASDRKLTEVIPGSPIIDESGILIPVTFAGTWTPSKLDANAEQVRALLAVPDEVRTEIKPGGTADRSLIRVRTRVRELELNWTPEREGIGLNADTGEVVDVNDGDRLLVAGTSGSGKSGALRVLFAKWLRRKHTALVILDLKKVEGGLWRHVARVESEPEGIQDVVDDLIEEMRERETIMEANDRDLWEPTKERPRIVVAVDEGAEFMLNVPDAVTGTRSLAMRARASGIILWWATQKPTLTGAGYGLDSATSGQLTTQICMAVASARESRTVFGEDAKSSGWHAEDLAMGGWALIQAQGENRKPDPTRFWYMTTEDVKALPPRDAWRRSKKNQPVVNAPDALEVALRLSEGLQGVSTVRIGVALGVSDAEVHVRMRVHGVEPEPNAFAMGNGERVRGYRRDKLEQAFNRRNQA
jgi:S-DNA-T family DNA segregation ATPase FtsK/SpoIIIE